MRFRPVMTFCVIAALLGGLLAPAQAADERRRKDRIDAALKDLRHQINETSVKLRVAAKALRRAESRLPAARSRVARVHGQLVAAQARDRMLAERLAVAEAEVARAARRIDEILADIAASRVLIGRIARSSYQSGGMGELAVVLQSTSPDDFAARLVLVQNAMRSESRLLGELSEGRADLAAQRATLVAKREQVAATKREQEATIRRVQRLKAEAIEARESVKTLISERERAVARVEREKAAEETRYARMQAESQRLSRILATRARRARIMGPRSSVEPGQSGGVLSPPVSAAITSSYGMRVHPITGVYKLHDGTDFGVGCGTPVRAAAAGTVIQAANVPGYGNQLVIDHGRLRGAGVATSYSHMMRFTRGVGARVTRGEIVGYSGGAAGMSGAGYSTGCHQHFMVYVNGSTTDPLGWL